MSDMNRRQGVPLMPVAGADHGIGFATDILVKDLAALFAMDIVFNRKGVVCPW